MDQFEFDASPSVAVAASAAYAILVYCLQDAVRKPVKLRWITFAHDVFLWLASAWLLGAIAHGLIAVAIEFGFEALWCDSERVLPHRGWLQFWYYVFYLSKFYEYGDTLLLILAKKRVIFLHAWHHCSTVFVVWFSVTGRVPVAWVAICANLLVHMAMYYYYALSVLGIRSAWKRYITLIQIVQFIVDIGSVAAVFVHDSVSEAQCSGDPAGYWIPALIVASFLVLFLDFYRGAYKSE